MESEPPDSYLVWRGFRVPHEINNLQSLILLAHRLAPN